MATLEEKTLNNTNTIGTVQLSGIHHLKIPVSDLDTSLAWYARVLGAVRLPEFDHVGRDGKLFAYIISIPGVSTLVELRLSPKMSENLAGFDPTVFAVDTLASLTAWRDRLDNLEVENSSILRGLIGWLLIFHDPDGLSVRFYTNETHEFDAAGSDMESPWVAYPS